MGEHIWNFNGDIAFPLEKIARKILNLDEWSVKDTIFCAAQIGGSTFAEAMYELLRQSKIYVDSNDVRTFEKQLDEYWGKGYMDIPKDKATELFQTFKRIVNLENEEGE